MLSFKRNKMVAAHLQLLAAKYIDRGAIKIGS